MQNVVLLLATSTKLIYILDNDKLQIFIDALYSHLLCVNPLGLKPS